MRQPHSVCATSGLPVPFLTENVLGHQATKWVKGEKIGVGLSGTVYLGMDASTGELMAVKQIELPGRTSLQQNTIVLASLEREIGLLKSLDHPNVIQYFGKYL